MSASCLRTASTSSGGASVVTLQFSLELDLDSAEQGVQAAINAGSNLLPTDIPAPPVYSKVNPADAPILTLGLSSRTLPLPEIQIFGGGAHAGRRVDLQDFMVIATGAQTFAEALDWTAEVYRAAGLLMAERGLSLDAAPLRMKASAL